MAKFFLASSTGANAFIGRRLKDEGHKVRMFIREPYAKDVYNGILDKATRPLPNKDEIVIMDSNSMDDFAEEKRRSGYRVIGGGTAVVRLEDPIIAQDFARSRGVKMAETRFFGSTPQAVEFLRTTQDKWLYLEDNPRGILESFVLSRYLQNKNARNITLQKYIGGDRVGIYGWFDGKNFIQPLMSATYDNSFLSNDLGPAVDTMATVMWTYDNPSPRLFVQTIERTMPFLRLANYVGLFGAEGVLDDAGDFYVTRWATRFNNGLLPAFSFLSLGNLGQQFVDLTNGHLRTFDVKREYSLALNVSIPPFPYRGAITRVPVDPLVAALPNKIYAADIMVDAYKIPTTAGSSGIVGYFGATGETETLAKTDVQALVESVRIPNIQYRADGGDRTYRVLASLSRHLYDPPLIKALEKNVPKVDYETETKLEPLATLVPVSGNKTNSNLLNTPLPDSGTAPTFS